MLRAPLAALGSGQPLAELSVTTTDGAAVTLSFGERLGLGGTSDVYAVTSGVHAANACAKVPRFTTAVVDAQFSRERAVLDELAELEGACVPRVVCEAERDGAAVEHLNRSRWPLLVIAPAGVPLSSYVRALAQT